MTAIFMQSGFQTERQTCKFFTIFVVAAVFAPAFFKIVDRDFWWHLETGQIIWQQKAFQYHEIYSFTANGREYIDHEWLFQLVIYFFYRLGGPAGVILLKCSILILIFLMTGRNLLKNGASTAFACAVVLLSICGASIRFIERPELFSILYLVVIYLILDRSFRSDRWPRLLLLIPLVTVAWVNTHAAVVLGLLLQFTFLVGLLAERSLKRLDLASPYIPNFTNILVAFGVFIASLVLTGVNPYGYRVLKVPFELTSIIDSGLLKNLEWQRPTPAAVPFYFLCLGFTLLTMLFFIRRFHPVNTVFGLFLAYISLRYIRNVGVFCMFMPLLIAPFAEILSTRKTPVRAAVILLIIGLVAVIRSSSYEWGIGEASYFPDQIVKFTKEKNLRGNMINSYGFGGYLIWNLYPERKIFVDGRNEVYLPLLKKLISMVGNNLTWNRLLDEYQIQYALLNYVDDLETVTQVDRNGHALTMQASFTSTHFPKSRWALIDWDDDGMVFIRRTGVNQNLLNLEYKAVYPEGRSYQEMLMRSGQVDAQQSIVELQKKLAEDPDCRRAQTLLQVMRGVSP